MGSSPRPDPDVAGTEPAEQRSEVLVSAPAFAGRSNLALRVVSSLVLAPLALFVAYLGGWPFELFWAAACLVVLCEWILLVTGRERIAPSRLSTTQVLWIAAGVAYATAMLIATLKLRDDASYGLAAILFVFAVVWLTDIAAYFAGRAFGGPKLMPRVSPKKTWSGAGGGTLAGVIGGIVVATLFGLGNAVVIGLIAFVLSVVSQAGDLLESAIKRHFDAKDSGSILPGHGGLMDRLDGFATAVVAAALIGMARGGFDAPARGLLVW